MAQLPAGAARTPDPADIQQQVARVGSDCHATDQPTSKAERALWFFKQGFPPNYYEQQLVNEYIAALEAKIKELSP